MTETILESSQTSLRGTLRKLVLLVEGACKSPASSASLRRSTPFEVANSAAFYRVLANAQIEDETGDRLLRWATVVQCMAIGGDSSAPLPDGAMLARAGFSESRFSRLLAAGGSTVQDQCVLAARFLHSRDHSCRWDDLGALLILDAGSTTNAEQTRLRLAREYYRSLDD
jgi:CRISPR system Cascade subunit CasB